LADDQRLAFTGGLEVVVGGARHVGHGVELVQVHRIGALGTRRDVGDLALAADITNGDAVGAVSDRVRTQGDAVVRIGRAVGANRGAVVTKGGAVVTNRRAVDAAGPGVGAQSRGVESRRIGEIAQRGTHLAGGFRQAAIGGA